MSSLASAALAQANLTLDGLAMSSHLAPGSPLAVDVYYENSGVSAAADVKLTISVPPGFLYEGYQAQSPFTCTEPPKDGHGDLICTASSLGIVTGYVEADLQVDPAAVPGTVITLSATLTSSNAVKPTQTTSGSTTVVPATNLRIGMSAPASAMAGDTFLITFTVTNDGPISAGFTELDIARQGLVSWSAITGPAGWRCVLGSCTTGSFAPGTATFTISASTSASTTLTSVREQAEVYSVSDADYSDNVVSGTTAIVALPHAELNLSVVTDKTTDILGQPVTNTYTVTNEGPDSTTYVELQIGFPGSLSNMTSTFASCTQTEPVQCTAPPLAAGGVLTATVTFIPDQLGTNSTGGRLQWGNNSQTFGTTAAYTTLQVIPDPAQPADLSTVVTMPSTAVDQGGTTTASGQITVTNAGPWPAQLVTVNLDGVSSATLPGFICGWDGSHYTCTTASMAPGSATGTLTATWPAAANGTPETTTAAATSLSRDPDTTNNSASAKTTVLWQSNLTLRQLSVPSLALAGSLVAVDAHYFSPGPSMATDVKLTITVPAGATYESYSASSNVLKCTEPPKGGHGDLVCTASSLAYPDDDVEVNLRVDPAATPGTVITIPATLTASDSTKPPQTTTGSLTVAAPANLKVTLSSPSTVIPGNSYSNTVTVTNMGPGKALNVELTLTGVSDFTSEPAGWGCAVFTCQTPSFAPGTATITFTTRTAVSSTSGTRTQTATVTTVVDPDDSDNVATSTTTIAPGALTPVSLQFTASSDSVATGGTLTYTARIANNGSVDAKNVELWLYLPGNVLAASCGSVPLPHCTFPTIAAGATQTVTATTQIYEAPGTSVYADAIVVGANFLNNIPTTSVTTIVSSTPPPASADLSASANAPTSANVGDLVTFTVSVTNAGNLDASSVSVQQTLPPGLAFVSASAGCSGSPAVTCTMPLLTSGASATFTVTATATAAGTATVTSTAATTSPEQNTANNSATATVVIHTPQQPARRRAARH
ncbi:MAG TPA: CARDB domain-containing protein [Thermoanaerobaculia bacterium]